MFSMLASVRAFVLALVVASVGVTSGRAQDAATPTAPSASQEEPAEWTNFKGDAGRTGLADAGPTGQPVELWRAQADGPCSPPPAVVAGIVYASCGDGILRVLDAATGAEHWRFAGSGLLGDVTVVGGLAYVVEVDRLIALDAASGEMHWEAPVSGGTGAVVDDGLLVIGTADGFLLGLDAASGVERWRFVVAAQGAAHNPALADGIAYVGGDEPGFFAVDATSGELLWRGDTGDNQTGTAVVAGGIAYIGGSADSGEGHLYAFDAKTGSLLWTRDEPIFTPAVEGGNGYGGSVAGIVYAFDTATGTEQWRVQLGGVVRPLAVAQNVVYAPSDGDRTLYALDAATGNQLWAFPVDGGIDSSIAVAGGVAYVTTMAGSIYAIGGTDQGAAPIASPVAPETPPVATPDSTTGDPVELIWQAEGGDSGLSGPANMALDSEGRLWVADSGNSRFALFSADGEFLEYWGEPGTGEGQFILLRNNGDPLGSIAFAPDGSFYVLDIGNYRIQAFSADRTFMRSWGGKGTTSGTFSDPTGIAVDAAGTVFVLDGERDVVEQFSSDGTVLGSFDAHPDRPGGFNTANGLAVDAQGNIYVSDIAPIQIEKFDPAGQLIATIGAFGQGDGKFAGQPISIVVDATGRIFVTETPEGGRVQVFDAGGQFLAAWGSVGQFPFGIALDDQGNVYVDDLMTNNVQKFRLLPPLAQGAGAVGDATPAASPAAVAPVEFI